MLSALNGKVVKLEGSMGDVLKEHIQKLKGELIICKAALGNEVLAATPKLNVDVSKPKEFNGMRSAKDVDKFLWGMGQYFHAKRTIDDATKRRHRSIDEKRGGATIGTWEEFQSEKNEFYFLMNGLKPWTKIRITSRGVKELTKAMTIMEFVIDLIPRKDKFNSSKPNEKGNGGGDKEGQVKNSNGGNGNHIMGIGSPTKNRMGH
ncbi:hypothetical protein PVK06_042671 [Gossypium arboreum]|uniref:Uncharacterized protein n=1 Tax=Gossypium arboreum TaxID=29729 RepID=A0ABR0MNG5_GOSAR|nr:hypothetical protein PVK06_042671 [Gossypium arboreum]